MKKEDNEPLGFSGSGYEYMRLLPEQKELDEFFEIRDFLREVATSESIPELQNKKKKIQFINYGDTQLVYVLTVGDKKFTLLLGQPATEFGVVKKEYENLKILYRDNPDIVVAPIHYFSSRDNKRELYMTPYLYQARCIASDEEGWGVYVPEPDYHFRTFTQTERNIVNSSMIALLIKLFDTKNNLGLGSCKIGGGDFILEKEIENEDFTYENVLKRMKLIAARELVPMQLEEYINVIRKEFSKPTYYRKESERDKSIIINHKSRIAMTEKEIEKGIELGRELRKEKEIERY